ncbi:MAG: hypothetical protein E7603_05350 [Ruminococcaceae bacterium]|nr:hypothetical protein [Oscillospiraceae bacterium]
MKKSWIRFIAFLLAFALPVFAVSTVVFLTPSRFEETFLGEFEKKVDRLYETEGEKIVIIGGSSLAFGLDAKLLSETLGKPVINFGLYATLGTKVMMDYTKDAIGEGDIIVIAPEMNEQTWSTYFNAEAMWQALDGNFSDFRHIDSDNYPAMLGSFWKFAASKAKYFKQELDISGLGIYKASSFDEYGYIANNRDKDYNIMAGGFDSGKPITFSTDMISPEFVDYVNEYVKYAEKKGAKVYLASCPINESALPLDVSMEDIEAYCTALEELFDCPVLGRAEDGVLEEGSPAYMIYPSGYFFDSNFHLNSAGAVLHTKQFALGLAPLVGKTADDIQIEEPEAPEIPEDDTVYEYDENEVYFTFNVSSDGVVSITGLSELGKAQTTLCTPVAYEGKKVSLIAPNAFNGGSSLVELTITDNILKIQNGAFRGADSLKKIHVLSETCATEPEDNDVAMRMLEGLSKDCRFYVPSAVLDSYKNNYFWFVYADYILGE